LRLPSSGENHASEKAKDATVTVQGQRSTLSDRVHTFVRQLTGDPRFYGESVARWRVPLCFRVSGLAREQGEFVIGRLSGTATAAGTPPAAQGCHPNLYVIVTAQPDRVVKALYARDARTFSGASPADIERFLDPSKPKAIRAWYNIEEVGPGGTALNSGGTCYTPPGGKRNVNCRYSASRLALDTVLELSSAIVFVDVDRVKGFELDAIADYIAMVVLSDLDLDADLGDAPTILRLFTALPSARPMALSPWDRAFLHAIYQSQQESKTERVQVEVRMIQDISK